MDRSLRGPRLGLWRKLDDAAEKVDDGSLPAFECRSAGNAHGPWKGVLWSTSTGCLWRAGVICGLQSAEIVRHFAELADHFRFAEVAG